MVLGKIIGFSLKKKTCIVLLPDGRAVEVLKTNFPDGEEGSIVEIKAVNFGSIDERIESPPKKLKLADSEEGLVVETKAHSSTSNDECSESPPKKPKLADSEEGLVVETKVHSSTSNDECSELPPNKRRRHTTPKEDISGEGDDSSDNSSNATHGTPRLKTYCYVFLNLFGLQYLNAEL